MTMMKRSGQAGRIPRALVAALAGGLVAAALGGCGNLSRVSADGTTDTPRFPDVSGASRSEGSWPNLENLRAVREGMSKTQVSQLLGPPHFSEGLLGVREWDYLLWLTGSGGVTPCQFKVLFNTAMTASSFHWKPQTCAELLAPSS